MQQIRSSPVRRSWIGVALLLLAMGNAAAGAADRPVSGKAVAEFEPVDHVIVRFMDTIGCQAATVAVSKNGRMLYTRGYGWADAGRTRPVAPDALMRIASVTKPITAAAIKNNIRAGKLSLDTRAFEVIAVKAPGGKIKDARVAGITVGQLLKHRGGWDRSASFDPMFRTQQIEKELQLRGPAEPVNVIEYMLARPLQFTPGEKTAYSNFGYCVLGRVLERVMKKPYAECIRLSVCEPLGIKDIRLGYGAVKKRHAREVWNPVDENAFSLDVMDAHGGLIASAPALCRFLDAYWISGDPRLAGQRANWTFFGSLPGTTAMVRQRRDGINIAVLCNGRRNKHLSADNKQLREAIDRAIDEVGISK